MPVEDTMTAETAEDGENADGLDDDDSTLEESCSEEGKVESSGVRFTLFCFSSTRIACIS